MSKKFSDLQADTLRRGTSGISQIFDGKNLALSRSASRNDQGLGNPDDDTPMGGIFNMRSTLGYPYMPLFPMGPMGTDDLYQSLGFRTATSAAGFGGFAAGSDFPDIQPPQLQMQDSVMLGTKRKAKEEPDNESPESLTGNDPKLQRPTPKAAGNLTAGPTFGA